MKYLSLLRYNEWWEYKLSPLIALGYATVLLNDGSILYSSVYLAFLILTIIIGAAYVSLINDITDIKEDLKCGKYNRMSNIPIRFRWVFPSLCLLAGSGVFYYLWQDKLSAILYAIPWLAFSLYSFEPFRLKRRGIWGVLADASGSHVFTSLYIVAAMSYFPGSQINWVWFFAVGVWALFYGLRGILWHQFYDRENDLKSGIKTFASNRDPQSFFSRSVLIFSFELLALTAILIELRSLFCLLFLLLYFILTVIRHKKLSQPAILIQAPKNKDSQILMMDYYQIFWPFALLCEAIFNNPQAIWILIAHLILFPRGALHTLKDLYSLRPSKV